MGMDVIIFGGLALLVIGSALGMVISRNAIYSALFLAINFIMVGFLYIILGAPFIAMVQVTVYAGSIMILFVFVIMLLGAEKLPIKEHIPGQRLIAITLGVLTAGIGLGLLIWKGNASALVSTPPEDFASPVSIGTELFGQFPLLFLVTSVILLVATVGAILLTRGDPGGRAKKQ